MAKEYGLITKKKSSSDFVRHTVFGSDSDSADDEVTKSNTKVNLSLGKTQQHQIKKAQANALAEDPTIYQYDEIFDEVQTKRNAVKEAAKKADKNSKYVQRLLKTADKRKKDYERHIERQVQKDREADADMYQDKETFVTSSYRQKLEEMKKLDEEERREEYLEAIGDVTKQRDLGGFYRHLYEQRLGPDSNKTVKPTENVDDRSQKTAAAEPTTAVDNINKENTNQKKNRHYRKRKIENDDEEDDKKAKTEHLPSNLDADSDFSIDSSDSEDDKARKNNDDNADDGKFKKPSMPEGKKLLTDEKVQNVDVCKDKDETTLTQANGEKTDTDDEKLKVTTENESIESSVPKPKIDRWKKRTVGAIFDDALKRYFERKALRQSA